jgi:hypothetical protein
MGNLFSLLASGLWPLATENEYAKAHKTFVLMPVLVLVLENQTTRNSACRGVLSRRSSKSEVGSSPERRRVFGPLSSVFCLPTSEF